MDIEEQRQRVLDTLDKEAASLSSEDYRELLEALNRSIRFRLDAFEEEEED